MLTALFVVAFLILLALLFGGPRLLKVLSSFGIAALTGIAAFYFVGENKKDAGQFYALHICKAAAAVVADVGLDEVDSIPLSKGKLFSVGYSSGTERQERYICSIDNAGGVVMTNKVIDITEPHREVTYSANGDKMEIVFLNDRKLINSRYFQRSQFAH